VIELALIFWNSQANPLFQKSMRSLPSQQSWQGRQKNLTQACFYPHN